MPLLWISIAFIAGAVVPLFQPVTIPVLSIAGIVLFLAGFFEKRLLGRFQTYTGLRKTLPVPVCLLIAAFLGGIIRGGTYRPDFKSDELAFYNDKGKVTILAMASQPVENHDKSTMLTVSSRLMKVDDSPAAVTGEAVLLLPAGIRYSYGDLLEITGDLVTPPEREDFSYKQYLENSGVFSYMAYPRITVVENNAGNPVKAVIFTIRDRIAESTEKIMAQPEAAFLSGILVGRDEDIPDSLKAAFRNTGTSHLVAISGFNITIVAGLILALTGWLLPKKSWSVGLAIIILIAYAVMAGASPSVVRAAIMGALAMIGRAIGRNRTAVNGLGLAAAVMTAFNPLILRDIGFQLSVAATAGILLIGAPAGGWVVNRFTSDTKPSELNSLVANVSDAVIITLGAQIATLPFLLYHFHSYPLISLLVNPFVLPVQPAAMILGGLAALVGIVWLPLGQFIGLAAWIPLVYTTRMVEWFAAFHGIGLINLHLNLWLATGIVLLLILAVIFGKVWMKRLAYTFQAALAIVAVISLVFLINALFIHPDGLLHIQIFRQGSDLSSYIVTPGGQRILVTNRPGDKDLTAFIDRRLPLARKHLDAVIIPNPTSSSSILMADSLARFQPEWLLVNGLAGGAKVQAKMDTEKVSADRQSAPLESGQRFDLGRGALLTIQSVDVKGSRLAVTWGSQSINLVFGNSPEIDTGGASINHKVDVKIVDHPADSFKDMGILYLVDVKNLPVNVGNQVTVSDGAWVSIEMDGNTHIVLEKPDDAS